MSKFSGRIGLTGATGQLGRLVIAELSKTTPPAQIVALARSVAAGAEFGALGVEMRSADYTRPETLDSALIGVERLLLISAPEFGQRFAQHRNVIDAAKRAGVREIVYTSILHADTSPLAMAEEHRQTERLLKGSGIPFVVLRNGWYTENDMPSVPAAVAHGTLLGASGDGRLSWAARADYAAAAAAVLTAAHFENGRIYELAGDASSTRAELAAEIARRSGKPVAYNNLPEVEYKAALVGFGLPDALAGLLADSDVGASRGGLFDDGHQLSTLIGRPTTPLAVSLSAVLDAESATPEPQHR